MTFVKTERQSQPRPMEGERAGGASRRLIVLGSTGSIGVNTLAVVENLEPRLRVVGLAAGSNAERLAEQARRFEVERVSMSDTAAAETVRSRLPGVEVHGGAGAAERLIEETEADVVVAAMVGAAGLGPTLAAIGKGMDIALANKETLVAAGPLVMPRVREAGVRLLPVDSEHSAIFQCLQGGVDEGGVAARSVKRIVLTASGGPFRDTPLERVRTATVAEALAHPTWKMGRKITIDSATMMNKALEIIEAHWLFGLRGEQIAVIIHPQSIAHSFVEFTDHSVLAQLGPPDMRTPIQYALTYPERAAGCSAAMDWAALSRLDFAQPDPERFPALGLAYRVIEMGGTAGAILNAANEEAVAAFLGGRIPFGRIVALTGAALERAAAGPIERLEDVLAADAAARRIVAEAIG